jgi:uncharacterized membrane protein YedE/YeeE
MPHDYVMGLLGGLLMGMGCAGLMFFNGRILGVSGLLGGALSLNTGAGWRRAFIGGMVIAGGVALLAFPTGFEMDVDRTLGANIVGAILVGTGTQLGSGCTSGHGICGVGRLSLRSLVATVVFMAGGAASVYVIRTMFGGSI